MSADLRPLTDEDLCPDLDDDRTLTKAQARRITEQIKLQIIGLWDLVKDAYIGRAWVALGYESWDAYCSAEFPTSRMRLPREERAEVVSSLRESGLSLRAIEAATGVSRPTIIKDLSGDVVNSLPPEPEVDEDALAEELIASKPPGGLTEDSPGQTDRVQEALDHARKQQPAPVIGMDGKTYRPKPAPQPKPDSQPKRKPLPDAAVRVGYDLGKILTRLEKLLDDDRFDRNLDAIGRAIRQEVDQGLRVFLRLNSAINASRPNPTMLKEIAGALANAIQMVGPEVVDDSLEHFDSILASVDAVQDHVEHVRELRRGATAPAPPNRIIGRSNQKQQVTALENTSRELAGIAAVLEGVFDHGYQQTCTPEIRTQRAQEIKKSTARINAVLRAITVDDRSDPRAGAE